MRRLVLLAMVGLVAQLVDGSLGMGYGVTSATLLVAAGIAPVAASAAIHFSELGTTLVSGISHHTLGNTDWRTSAYSPHPASSVPLPARRCSSTSTPTSPYLSSRSC